MKIRQQLTSAVAAVALLGAASAAVLISSSGNSSFADTISAEAVAALTSAVTNPTAELAAQLQKMDQEQPGSSQQFVQAIQSAQDTGALAAALQTVAAGSQALQETIAGALATVAADPHVAAVATAAGEPSVAQLVSTTNSTFAAATGISLPTASQPSVSPQNVSSSSNITLPDLSPAAGPNPSVAAPRPAAPMTIHVPTQALSAGSGAGGAPVGALMPLSTPASTNAAVLSTVSVNTNASVTVQTPHPGKPNSRP